MCAIEINKELNCGSSHFSHMTERISRASPLLGGAVAALDDALLIGRGEIIRCRGSSAGPHQFITPQTRGPHDGGAVIDLNPLNGSAVGGPEARGVAAVWTSLDEGEC